ncbi:MAG: DinB family protein, partial [Candidatus Promineifilaceae bacterium]
QGHILAGRNEALSYLGAELIWDEAELARYKTGSPPITRADQALPLERLLRDFEESQQRIVTALESASAEALATIVDTRFGERPLGQHIDGLHWHETYHTGQLEILRALALSPRT